MSSVEINKESMKVLIFKALILIQSFSTSILVKQLLLIHQLSKSKLILVKVERINRSVVSFLKVYLFF